MLFRILGNVSVVDDGAARAVAAPRQRALLALLLLDTNRVVTRSTLVEGIWGDDGPQHEDAALQVVMSRLRRTIGPAADRITSTGAGYRLDAGPEEVDLTKAEMMLREGRAQLALNNGARAANILDEALAHWDGNPLDDLAAFPFQPDAARRLRELWFAIYEARTDAYLMDGRHLEVVADIGPRVRVEPLREHLRAQQIAALYRSGRQADALAAAGELRKTLRDELGISPSPALQQLEQRVLDQDPTLLSTNAGVLPALPPWTAEALPFVGRESELESALQAMRDAVATGFEFVLVEGDPGSGKSRFLLEVARRIGRDAVVVPVDVHEALHASVVALARGIDEAARRLSPRDRLLTLGDAHPGDRVDDEPTVEQIHAEAPRWIAALSGKAPVLLLVDDLDRAGPGLLHVIAQLALLESSKRVLIVAGARPPQTTGVSPLERLVCALEVRDQATRIVLPPLGLEDLDVLLGRMHVAPRRRITRRLHDLTAGNAFLLNELLSTGQPERMLDTWQVPPRVRDVVLARVDELGRGVKEVLQHAAVVGFDFTISTLAEVCETSEMVVRAAVDRAISARILQPSGAHTVRFAHDLARRTLIEELPASERSLIHRRIALLLEATDVPAAGLAAHWSRADGPDVAAKTAFYARVAGDDAMRVLEPYHAARWYHLALEHVTDTKTRGELLAALAEALQQAGDPAFVDTLHEATHIAIDLDDDDLILRIVTSTSPGFVNLPGFTAAESLPLLARALGAARDDATRSRIVARMAADEHLRDPARSQELFAEAFRAARSSGDDVALLEALLRHASTLLTPESLELRRHEIDEALPLAIESRDVAAQYSLFSLRVVTAIESADLAAADAAGSDAAHLASRYDLAPLAWSVRSRRAWRAGLSGCLDDAERLVLAARDYGKDHGIIYAETGALLQLAMLRWQQGRAHEAVDLARSNAEQLTQLPALRLLLARALATTSDGRDEARDIVVELGPNAFEALPRTTFWSTALIATAETALHLEMPDAARTILRLLEPYVDQVAVPGNWVVAPIAHGAAVAAAVVGDRRAPELFERAIAIADRLEAPVLRARSELAWLLATRECDDSQRPAHPAELSHHITATAEAAGLRHMSAFARKLERESTAH